ncbi:hypothetical protein Tco_0139164 [Tanacetum coccineum]
MTDEIRRALCKHNKDNPSLTQKQLQEWVHSNYGLQLLKGLYAAANRYNIRTEARLCLIICFRIREGPKTPQWWIKGYLLLGSRYVRKRPLNDSPTSVYSEGASTVANTLEAKEASNGQVTDATFVALENLNQW